MTLTSDVSHTWYELFLSEQRLSVTHPIMFGRIDRLRLLLHQPPKISPHSGNGYVNSACGPDTPVCSPFYTWITMHNTANTCLDRKARSSACQRVWPGGRSALVPS